MNFSRENEILDVLVALALRQDELTDVEIEERTQMPMALTDEDRTALRSAPAQLLVELRSALRPQAKAMVER